jgi:hypothetical protein
MDGDLEENGHSLIEILSRIFLRRLKKSRKSRARKAGIPTEIRTKHLPNTSQEFYHYASSLQVHHSYFVGYLLTLSVATLYGVE